MSKDPLTDRSRPLTRRSALQALGTLLVGGGAVGTATGKRNDGSYQVAQGDRTFAVEPLSGDVPVEELYSYRLPDGYSGTGVHDEPGGPFFESVGTRALQRESTTITFLYDGPNGLSLVVVHDRSAEQAAEGDDGGSVTWEVVVHDADANWRVKDDEYWNTDSGEPAETNYDDWNTDGNPHQIDWTWAAGGTDGGVLGYIDHETALQINPSYNEQATLYDEHYQGEITEWEFISGSADGPERTSLALDEPVAVVGANGDWSAVTVGDGTKQEDGRDGEQDDETTEKDESTEKDDTTEKDQETKKDEETRDEDGDDNDDHEVQEDGDDEKGEEDEEKRDEREKMREEIAEKIEEIEEKRKEIEEKLKDLEGEKEEKREELREEIEELRTEIEEIREEIQEKREDLREELEGDDADDDDDEKPGLGLALGNGEGKGKKKGKKRGKKKGKKKGKEGKGKSRGKGKKEGKKLGW